MPPSTAERIEADLRPYDQRGDGHNQPRNDPQDAVNALLNLGSGAREPADLLCERMGIDGVSDNSGFDEAAA